MHPIAQAFGEIGDGESLMLCSNQHNREMPEEISRGTSESHVFKSNGLCMTGGIEEYLKYVSMQVVKHMMNALGKKGKRRIRPLTEEYVHCCEEKHRTC